MQSNFVLGPLNIDSTLISSLRSQLEETVMPAYLDLKEEANQKIQADPDCYNNHDVPSSRLGLGLDLDIIRIPNLPIKDISYSLVLLYNISSLTPESPLGIVASIVNDFVMQYGIKFDRVELRFERACFEVAVPYWHYDSGVTKRAFSLCWSSRQNWNTHIVEREVIDELRDKLRFNVYSLSSHSAEKIKPFDQPAKENYMYDVQQVLHRSPYIEDLGKEPLSQDDWRIFLRFSQMHQGIKNAT